MTPKWFTEEALLGTRSLAEAIEYEMPVSKKRFVEVLRFLAGEVKSRCSECEATTQQLYTRVTNEEQLEWKVVLLSDEAGKIGVM